jgi:hypothetical protein
MDDVAGFATFLRSLDGNRLRDVIGSLEIHEDEFRPEQVVPASVVLLNLSPELPESQGGMFNFGSRLVVTRVVYRLVKSLKSPEAIDGAVREILPEVEYLSCKLDLISIVGHRKGRGHKLVSESAASDLEKQWREEVRKAGEAKLAMTRKSLEYCSRQKLRPCPKNRCLVYHSLRI